ncbi:MAG: hypothetical protein ACRERE_30375 [Candidatus Entotheonellia bacterium]
MIGIQSLRQDLSYSSELMAALFSHFDGMPAAIALGRQMAQ